MINRKIGMYCSIINLISVIGFAISMLLGFNMGSYFCSMFIAFSFVPMTCGYAHFAENSRKLAGYIGMAFSAMYATIIVLVYFAQLTTVRMSELTEPVKMILDFQKMGLMFNYDLLGYALMALATFFAGLTVKADLKTDKWLKYLLMVHGILFVSCLILPMLGLFKADSPAWIGVAVLEFWCLYFSPISVLSFLHFLKCRE